LRAGYVCSLAGLRRAGSGQATTSKHPNDEKEWITVKDRSPAVDIQIIPREGQLLVGPLFNEPMLVETVRLGGEAVWTVGLVGSRTHLSALYPKESEEKRLLDAMLLAAPR